MTNHPPVPEQAETRYCAAHGLAPMPGATCGEATMYSQHVTTPCRAGVLVPVEQWEAVKALPDHWRRCANIAPPDNRTAYGDGSAASFSTAAADLRAALAVVQGGTDTPAPEACDRVTPGQIEEQRRKGWTDWGPERYCHKCGHRNTLAWYVNSRVWNQVLRTPDGMNKAGWPGAEIVCVTCFTGEADRVLFPGSYGLWELVLESALPDTPAPDCRKPLCECVRGVHVFGDWCTRCRTGALGRLERAKKEGATALVEKLERALEADDFPCIAREPRDTPPQDAQCAYTFPLRWWMGKDQEDPCRCDLPSGHDGEHACDHIRSPDTPAPEPRKFPPLYHGGGTHFPALPDTPQGASDHG